MGLLCSVTVCCGCGCGCGDRRLWISDKLGEKMGSLLAPTVAVNPQSIAVKLALPNSLAVCGRALHSNCSRSAGDASCGGGAR